MSKILFKGKEVDSTKKIKRIISSPEISKIVSGPAEKRELISEIKNYRSGGVTKDEARKILGKFHYDKKDSLGGKETAALAKAWGISGSHRYTRPEENSAEKMRTANRERIKSSKINNSPNSSKGRSFGVIRSLH